jgi:hypothetical protein
VIQPHQLALLRNRVRRPEWVTVGFTFSATDKLVTISTGYTRNPFHPGQERAWNDFEKVGWSQMSGLWMETESELNIRNLECKPYSGLERMTIPTAPMTIISLYDKEHDPETLTQSNVRFQVHSPTHPHLGPSPLFAAWQKWERDRRSRRP